ncbi:hypothetical protein Athai_54670 [Actinocatenispora thailandica]|uniref:Uncharacterized protein n=1 Tax=Actinocatenispora thailandica TaxID=227318 RepID=A0A7R7DU95_9ACTN|nr:hypothetical protein [Actinocatenispora thailandica]BCJ37964.1 hypothetical protein Athai_54670 [Actinocatenispora thailandica]
MLVSADAEEPAVPVRRRRRWPWVAAVAAVVVLAFLGVVVGAPLYREVFAPPTDRVLAAAAALRSAPAVSLAGGLSTKDRPVQRVEMTVGTKGETYGRLRGPGGTALVYSADGNTYLRADHGWLLANAPSDAGYQTDHWIAAGETMPLDLSRLTPAGIAGFLRSGLRRGDPKHAAVDAGAAYPTRIGGVGVHAYRLPHGAVAYLTSHRPYRVVAVDEPPGLAESGGHLALSVAPADRSRLRAAMAKGRRSFDDDATPAEPATYSTDPAEGRFGHCAPDSCSASSLVRADDGDTSAPGHLVGVFFADRAGKTPVGTCVAKRPHLKPGGSARVWCTTRGAAWHRYTATHDGGSVWFRSIALSPGYDGDQTQAVLDLNSATLQPMDWIVLESVGKSAEELAFADWLVTERELSVHRALALVDEVAGQGLLGLVPPLVKKGRLAVPTAAAAHPDRYREAARLAASGAGKVAVDSWTDPDGTRQRGDVFDVSGRRVVTTAMLDDRSSAGVRKAVAAAAKRARAQRMPDGFRRGLRIVVAPGSALYHVDPRALASTLRAAGVHGTTVRDIARVELVTGAGTGSVSAAALG